MKALWPDLLNKKHYRLSAFVVAVAGVLAWIIIDTLLAPDASTDTANPPVTPVTLLNPFKSYIPVSKAGDLLDSAGLTFTHDHLEVPLGNNRTRILDTLSVDGYKHHGISGKLSLHFLNGRLQECLFEPDDIASAARMMRNRMKLRPDPRKNGRTEVIQGHRRIASNVFYANSKVGRKLRSEAYILWQDTRLAAERKQP